MGRVAEEADSRKRKSQEDIASGSTAEETNNEKKMASEKGTLFQKKIKYDSVKEPEILESDTECMVVESENESEKLDSDKESDSAKESERSNSDKESGRSDSEQEESGSGEDSGRSDSDVGSGTEEETEKSGSEDETERSDSDEELEGPLDYNCLSNSSSSDESADIPNMIMDCIGEEGSENSSRMETSEEGSETSSKEESCEENSDNSSNMDSDDDSESSSNDDNDEESDNSSKDGEDESENSSKIDIDEISETSSNSSSEQESDSSNDSVHSLICDYMPFIVKQIKEDTIITPQDITFGYICFGNHDSMMVEALKKCNTNILLWNPNEDVNEEYLAENIEQAFDVEDLFNSCDVIVCYADKSTISKDFFLCKVDNDLFAEKQIINFTKGAAEDATLLNKAVQVVGGDYLEARIIKHPGIQGDQPVHIYASGDISAFDSASILFKQIANITHYCGPVPDQASHISTICSTFNGLALCALSQVKKLTHAIEDRFSPQEVADIFSTLGYESVPLETCKVVFNDEIYNSVERDYLSDEVTYLRFHKNIYQVLARKGAMQLSTTACYVNELMKKYNV